MGNRPTLLQPRSLVVSALRTLCIREPFLKLRSAVRQCRNYVEMRYAIRRCRSYIKSLGFKRGLAAYLKCHRKSSTGRIVGVMVPGAKWPLMLRSGTPDVAIFEQVYIGRQYDIGTPTEPQLIIDGGAHIGCATVLFATRFPRSTILAIEPESANFLLLNQNAAPYANVTAIQGRSLGRSLSPLSSSIRTLVRTTFGRNQAQRRSPAPH